MTASAGGQRACHATGCAGPRRPFRCFTGIHPSLVGTANCHDAVVSHAERVAVELVAETVRAAPECIAANHCRVEGVEGAALVLRNMLGGKKMRLRARVVVNAAGAWIDTVKATLGMPTRHNEGTKGSHLVLDNPQLLAALDGSGFSWDDGHGRMCIMYPFEDRVLLRATDQRTDNPIMSRGVVYER